MRRKLFDLPFVNDDRAIVTGRARIEDAIQKRGAKITVECNATVQVSRQWFLGLDDNQARPF